MTTIDDNQREQPSDRASVQRWSQQHLKTRDVGMIRVVIERGTRGDTPLGNIALLEPAPERYSELASAPMVKTVLLTPYVLADIIETLAVRCDALKAEVEQLRAMVGGW